MNEIDIRRIDMDHAADTNIPNEPFSVWGRMIPALERGKWTYTIEKYESATEMCFPDFPYEVGQEGSVFLGAYDGAQCIGLAVLRRDMFRYLYLDDLKVNSAYRSQGVGAKLITACMEEARNQGMRGVYTIGQDNNLSACLFYLKQGFVIGGFDNRCYDGTSQEGKANIYFYRDLVSYLPQ